MARFENFNILYYIVVPFVLYILSLILNRKKIKVLKVIGERIYPFLTKSVSHHKRNFKYFLQLLCSILFILALARPQVGEKKEKIKSEGVELLFVVDVSESMLTDDVKPSRLEQAKEELLKLVDLMPGNRMGIIAFAGNAVLLSPLTTDVGALKMYVESLSTQVVSEQGTNFESALRLAKESFERGGVDTDTATHVTRAIIISSDGEDHESGALSYAEKIANEGVRIFTLAYGTEKGGAIPVRDNMGFLRGYKKDKSGNTILSTVKGDALKKLAEVGKGSFYHASFGGNQIKNIANDIDHLEKTEFDSTVSTQYDEKFQILLLFAVLLAIVELFLGERINHFQFWKGRYEVPPG